MHFNLNLSDVLYSDTADREYTTVIVMPSGVIKANESFHICLEGPVPGGGNGIICLDLTNSPQQQSEEITITV